MNQLYNKFLENLILPAGDLVLGTAFIHQLNYWREIQNKTTAELHFIQNKNLTKLLEHARQNIPFYKRLNIDYESDPYLLIKKFPVMKKNIIKQELKYLANGDISKMVKMTSSGSSGVQGTVYMSKKNQSNQLAAQTLWWEWSGYKLGDSLLQTGITPNRGIVKTAKDNLLNTLYASAYSLDKTEILAILKQLQKTPREYFMGYASSLYVFSKVAEENNINNVHFKSVVSWGDKMFPHFRSKIEKQFNTKVFDTYGCTEGFMIAGECEAHRYHIMTPMVFLELLDDYGMEVEPGQIGHVVVTRLDNYVMPLIRYYLGDLAIAAAKNEICTCGRKFPLLDKIIGRDTDIVKTRSGKYMVVHAFTGIFEHIPEIRQFRVIQKDLDFIEIEYIKEKVWVDNVLDEIKKKIQGYLNEDFQINFTEVQTIPSTPSGKPQIIQSFLNQSVNA